MSHTVSCLIHQQHPSAAKAGVENEPLGSLWQPLFVPFLKKRNLQWQINSVKAQMISALNINVSVSLCKRQMIPQTQTWWSCVKNQLWAVEDISSICCAQDANNNTSPLKGNSSASSALSWTHSSLNPTLIMRSLHTIILNPCFFPLWQCGNT